MNFVFLDVSLRQEKKSRSHASVRLESVSLYRGLTVFFQIILTTLFCAQVGFFRHFFLGKIVVFQFVVIQFVVVLVSVEIVNTELVHGLEYLVLMP